MPEIKREFNNFTPGELTYHEAVEGGELTAQEMINLRADTNGALRQRHAIIAKGVDNDVTITGIAASNRHLLFIDESGRLFMQTSNGMPTNVPINNSPTKLSGRLSLISEYNDFYIITSEGEDQGYWIDIREGETPTAYNLGINPPMLTYQQFPIDPTNDPEIAAQGGFRELADDKKFVGDLDGFPNNTIYFVYKITYVRKTQEYIEGLPSEEQEPIPFNGTESEASEDIVISINRTYQHIAFVWNIPLELDPQITGFHLYRSYVLEYHPDTVFQKPEFRRVKMDLPGNSKSLADPYYYRLQPDDFGSTVRVEDRTIVAEWSDGEPYNEQNQRLPSTVKSIILHNDLIFAPNGSELRYSDLRDGIPVHSAFPEKNSINQSVNCTFAAAYRNLLLFGGSDGLWRLTGGTEYNFTVDRISNLGPIDGFAGTTTEDVFAYITPSGIYLSDGISTQSISNPLDFHFKNRQPIRGAIAFLPNGNIIFSIVFTELDGSHTRKTFFKARQWQQWRDIHLEQSARFNKINTTKVLIAEDLNFIREILWENTERGQDSTTDTTHENIRWSWQSQRLDFALEGIATKRKRFTELIIHGKADATIVVDGIRQIAPITAIFTIYDTYNNTETFTVQVTMINPHLYPTRVPIQRYGIAIDFKIEGQGNVDIRSLILKGIV